MAKVKEKKVREKTKKDTKYRKRLKKRTALAGKFGSLGFYRSTGQKNKDKKYPMPLFILLTGHIILVEE